MKTKIKKIFTWITSGITVLLFSIAIYVVIASAVAVKNNDVTSFFGYTFSVVPTESMKGEIEKGDYVIGEKVDYSSLKIGDTIIYYNADLQMYIVHKIIRQDEYGFKTQGVNPITNPVEDTVYVTIDNYVSKVVWNGSIFNLGSFFINNRAIIFLLLIAVLSLLAFDGIFDLVKVMSEKKKLDQENENDMRKRLEEEMRNEIETKKRIEEEMRKELNNTENK